MQVSNAGTTMGDMKITSFRKISSPYSFTTSPVTQGLYKVTTQGEEIVSRGMSITKDSAAVYMFDFGGIEIDSNRILFANTDNDLIFGDRNNEVETEVFTLTDNSNFSFKIDYYSEDKQKSNSPAVKFKIELIDAVSGEVLGTLKTEKEKNKHYKDLSYIVDTKGIGNKQVKLRLKTEGIEDANVEVYNTVTGGVNNLGKKGEIITFKGSIRVCKIICVNGN